MGESLPFLKVGLYQEVSSPGAKKTKHSALLLMVNVQRKAKEMRKNE